MQPIGRVPRGIVRATASHFLTWASTTEISDQKSSQSGFMPRSDAAAAVTHHGNSDISAAVGRRSLRKMCIRSCK